MAYVTNTGSASTTVTAIAIPANTTGTISGGARPDAIAITPNGHTILVSNLSSGTVTPIDLTVNPPTPGSPITVGTLPFSIAIRPDGNAAYVVNLSSNSVTPIDLTTNPPTPGASIAVGSSPRGIAIAPNGQTAYVANYSDGTVTPLDLTTNPPTPGPTIAVGAGPQGIAIAPNGETAYVANAGAGSITPIDLTTNPPTPGAAITIPSGTDFIAITSDGTKAYITCDNAVITPVDLTTNPPTPGTAISGMSLTWGIAITPDDTRAYVVNNSGTNQAYSVNIAAQPPTVTTIAVGSVPGFVAITPDPAPAASFIPPTNPQPGALVTFDASLSRTAVGTITNYFWDFGDGNTQNTASPAITHTYAVGGIYTVSLTVTNSTGTSTSQVFTGQTVSRQGGTIANTSQSITVGTVGPSAPTNGSGMQVLHRFPIQGDLINELSWTSPGGVAYFKVYRGSLSNLIGETASINYNDHQRVPGEVVTYFITSVDGSGNQSSSLSITVQPLQL